MKKTLLHLFSSPYSPVQKSDPCKRGAFTAQVPWYWVPLTQHKSIALVHRGTPTFLVLDFRTKRHVFSWVLFFHVINFSFAFLGGHGTCQRHSSRTWPLFTICSKNLLSEPICCCVVDGFLKSPSIGLTAASPTHVTKTSLCHSANTAEFSLTPASYSSRKVLRCQKKP